LADINIEAKYLKKEEEIVAAVAKELGIKHVTPTPPSHRVDGLFMCDDNEEIHHLIEAKSRNITSYQYTTTKLEIGKWMALKGFNEMIPTILAIGWSDKKIGYNHVDQLEPSLFSLMNRKKVRRPSDWQIAVEIPIEQFIFIEQLTV